MHKKLLSWKQKPTKCSLCIFLSNLEVNLDIFLPLEDELENYCNQEHQLTDVGVRSEVGFCVEEHQEY